MTVGSAGQHSLPGRLSGAMVRRLMRLHKITIKALATRHGITMKRIRQVREEGVSGFLAQEWTWLITLLREKPRAAGDG